MAFGVRIRPPATGEETALNDLRFDPIPLAAARRETAPGERKGKGQGRCHGTTGERWLDVNYGAVLRTLLVHGLGGEALHVIAPAAMPFADAATTGAITCFRAGRRDRGIRFREVSAPGGLGALEGGRTVSRVRLDAARRWSPFLRPAKPPPPGSMELGEICRVHRG